MRTHIQTTRGVLLALMIVLMGLGVWTAALAEPHQPPAEPDPPPADIDHDPDDARRGVAEPIPLHHERVRINLIDQAPRRAASRPRPKRSRKKRAARPKPTHTGARASRASRAEPAPQPARPPEPQPPMARRGSCPHDMVPIRDPKEEIHVCMDRFEAPNRPGSLPLVMYTWYQAEAWCEARGKRLCYDDEWIRACRGPRGWNYPYGPTHREGACNDDKIWLQYDRILQRRWPTSVGQPWVEDMDELLTAAAASSPTGAESAEHIQWLYQADPSGSRVGCGSYEGVFDLIGNVEEWVRRRENSGRPEFDNRLMGRFWAEKFHCGMTVSSHGNGFRFYEIGFRCCQDL